MIAKLTQTQEQERVLRREKRTPVFFVDADGNATHVILPVEEARRMFDDYLRRELQIGFDQAERGQVVEWDPDRIKAEGRKRLKQRSRSS